MKEDERVSLGLVGLSFGGLIANKIIKAGESFPVRLQAVCDLNTDLLDNWNKHPGVIVEKSLDKLLERKEIEAVGLFTPPERRAELIRRCIDAGKHVITTKPFERSSIEAQEILDYAQAAGKVLHLNSPPPCDTPEDLQIVAWRRDYNLGDPIGARYDLWAGRPEVADGTWYDDEERCPGGVLFRLGIYPINTLIRLLGEVASVQVQTSRLYTGRPTPDNALLSLHFKSGALASLYVTLAMSPPQTYKKQMTINYQRGIIYRNTGLLEGSSEDPPGNVLHLFARKPDGKRVTKTRTVSENDYQWENFAHAVRGESLADKGSTRLIVHGIEVTEAVALAVRSGRRECVRSKTDLRQGQSTDAILAG